MREAISIPAPELVMMVEHGVLSGEEPEAFFREKFNLAGTPLRIEFRTKENPYVKEEKN